ncbi:MAG: hypothetical protein ACYTEX_18265 [Planctomycetota bacterium]
MIEITAEQQRQIEVMMGQLKCPKDFKCHAQGFTNFPKLRREGKLLVCLEEPALNCAFSIPFGYGYYCTCPLINYVHNLKT